MTLPSQPIEIVDGRERLDVLLNPLRLRILEAARTPGSAAELARRLDEKPQKINYHVQRLARHGFLEKVEERRAGNVVETVYGAVAERYVLGSAALGELSPSPDDGEQAAVAHWLALQSRAEAELAEVVREARVRGETVPAFSLDMEFRFDSPEQRAIFARAVRELFEAIVSKYTTPPTAEGMRPGPGGPYRLLLGCYPTPEARPDLDPSAPRWS